MRSTWGSKTRATAPRFVLVLTLLMVVSLPSAVADEGEGGKPAPSDKPMLWVSKGEPPLYVFGTLRVPDPRAQALPRAVGHALDECDVYLGELPSADADLARLEAQAKRLSPLPVEAGGLKKLLGDDLYKRTGKLLPRSAPISTLESREPWYVRRLMVRGHLERVVEDPAKLLAHDLWDRALLEGLEAAGLDTVPEYLEAFDTLSLDEQVAWLQSTVERLEADEKAEVKASRRLVDAYLAGDPAKVQAIWREALPDGKLGEKLGRSLLADRVRRMLGRLAMRRKRAPDQVVFLALDAALLAGEKGALKLLAAQGHELDRMN